MIKKLVPLIFGVVLIFSCNTEKNAKLVPVNLTCESETAPVGIDIPKPEFGWQLADTGIGVVQSAYQILVATSVNLLDEEKADIWNSGKVESGASQFITYNGKPLQPFTTYYWAVKTWDTTKNCSSYSQPARFMTGVMNTVWKAKWIKPLKNDNDRGSVLYRKSFLVSKKATQATVFVSGVGAYMVQINGKRLGDAHLAPGWTMFEKKVQYQVYDATAYLNDGENVLGMTVAKFWDELENAKIASSLKFILQMKITFADGSSDWVVTDNSWKSHQSPIIESSYGKGEKFNANLEPDSWNSASYSDKDWQQTSESKADLKLISSQCPMIKVQGHLLANKITHPENNKYRFDFGREVCGWAKLNVNVKNGLSVKITYISERNEQVTENETDEYISNGKTNSWEPEFSYHKFRFIEVHGLPSNPDTGTVIAQLAYPDVKQNGSFRCADERINKINQLVLQTGKNALLTMLSGLPDENSRKASPVNMQAYSPYALYAFDAGKTFEKYCNDLKDFQKTNGQLKFNEEISGSPGWPEVVLVAPWNTYLFTGNNRVLKNNYEVMQAWQASQQRESDAQAPPYMHNRDGLGDLYSLDSTPAKPIGSAYYYYTSDLMSNIANALGKTDEATAFMELAGFTKDQYNQSYLTYRTSRYWANTQTAHIIPMAVGLTPLSYQQRVIKFIAADIVKNSDHPSTGVLSTHFLLPLLSENGEHELAYKLILQQTKPGGVASGSSSEIGGSWNDKKNSPYQLAFASYGEWLYSYLAGIRPDVKAPGFKHSIIDPNPAGDLKWTEASVNTSYGLLKSKWERVKDGLKVNVLIPANTTSTLTLPVANSKKAEIYFHETAIVQLGKVTAQCPKFIKFRGFNANMAVIDVGSGYYEFLVK